MGPKRRFFGDFLSADGKKVTLRSLGARKKEELTIPPPLTRSPSP